MQAVYVHTPFCVSKCFYCDFNSIGIGKAAPPEENYVEALGKEVTRWEKSLMSPKNQIDTLFFGGGTPSLLSPNSFLKIFNQLQSIFSFDSHSEKTIELNPKTADLEKMIGFTEVGFNRLSIGVQTLNDDLLHRLGRAHSSEEALQAIEWGIQSGFSKLSIDLMYGLPEQTIQDIQNSLERLSVFPLKHLSAYELILEEETEFFKWHARGKLPLPEEEKVFAMQESIAQFAETKGMRQYEVSNYSQLGEESQHNLHYWNYDSFVGLGAGAVSFLKGSELQKEFLSNVPHSKLNPETIYGYRLTNPKPLDSYQKNSHLWEGVEIEPISYAVAAGEYMMMGLRKGEGIKYHELESKLGMPFPDRYREVIQQASQKGWMEADASGCQLTKQGILFSNEILEQFFLEVC